MRRLVLTFGFAVALLAALAACGGDGDEEFILATTTSTEDSGLLDVLVPMFEDEYGYEVKVIAVGSGAALDMARRGDADGVLAHSPAAEEELVAAGDVVDRSLVMHNDFVIVGPPDDPAGVAAAEDLPAAMQAIADAEAIFISRGDESGTHTKELQIWEAAGISPGGSWYQESGQGMGETLTIAREKEGYTLADRGTYLALRDNLEGLQVVFEGERILLNIYHVMAVNGDKHDDVNFDAGRDFVEFMVSDEVQTIIGDFRREEFGEALFVPDAGKTVEQLP